MTTLRSSFSRLDAAAEGGLTVQDDLFDLSEGETANSVAALNALNAEPSPDEPTDAEVGELQETTITSEHVAADSDCTHGGSERSSLFIPATPTPHAISARAHASSSHGCSRPPPRIATSSEMNPSASELSRARSPVGLGFVTASVEVEDTERLEEFVEEDIANVITLFQAFNDGTHGGAGKFSLEQLRALKVRVEDAILFVHEIAA